MKKIFILHGWAYSTHKWDELVKQISSHHFEVAVLPIPGLTEITDKVWTLDDYVDWLKEKLGHEDQLILVGHSNGGRIALAYAAKYPTKLGHLILIGSAGIYHNELPIRIKRFVFKVAAKLGKKFTSSPVLRDLLYVLARESDYKNATPQMRQTMNNLITADLTDKLSSIIVKTTIIWGEKDKITPLSDGQIMHKNIKNSSLYVIKDAGHSPHFSNAGETAEKILEEIEI